MGLEQAFDTKSPATMARITGILWLISVGTGIFAEVFVRGSIIVRGDAAATATKIIAAESLGVLFVIEAVCKTVSSFGGFLNLDWVKGLGTYILLPGLPAEIGFPVWLLVFAINADKWRSAQIPKLQQAVQVPADI